MEINFDNRTAHIWAAVASNEIESVKEFFPKSDMVANVSDPILVAQSLEMVKLLIEFGCDWVCAEDEFQHQLVQEEKMLLRKELSFRYWVLKSASPKTLINGKLVTCIPKEILKKMVLLSIFLELPSQKYIICDFPIRVAAFANFLGIKPTRFTHFMSFNLIVDIENILKEERN